MPHYYITHLLEQSCHAPFGGGGPSGKTNSIDHESYTLNSDLLESFRLARYSVLFRALRGCLESRHALSSRIEPRIEHLGISHHVVGEENLGTPILFVSLHSAKVSELLAWRLVALMSEIVATFLWQGFR